LRLIAAANSPVGGVLGPGTSIASSLSARNRVNGNVAGGRASSEVLPAATFFFASRKSGDVARERVEHNNNECGGSGDAERAAGQGR